MRIAFAQINSFLGDFSGNRECILEFVKKSKDRRCKLVVFPELCLFGYWPSDLLERSQFVDEQMRELAKIEKQIPEGIAALIGLVKPNMASHGKLYWNAAALVQKGKKTRFFAKELLPSYDVFDEHRYFEPGDVTKNIFTLGGKKVLVTICEDIWASGEAWVGTRYPKNPLDRLKKEKLDLVVNLSASPYSGGKSNRRVNVAAKAAKKLKAPLIYANLVGAQDELIFDGGSFCVSPKGELLAQSSYFHEDLNTYDLKTQEGGFHPVPEREIEITKNALVLGIRDYIRKVGFQKVHLGLSGGIDSALVACLAADAVGPKNLTCIYLPGPYSTDESEHLAKKLAQNLGCNYHELSINKIYKSSIASYEEAFGKKEFGLMHENFQARIRANCLMAFANSENSMLLTTGNKSEYATGYATLYGDMCGGLAPIGDLLKSQTYEMSKFYNEEIELIPEGIITRAPSAELAPNQKDEDTLPPYDELDRIVKKLVVDCKPARGKTEKWVLKALARNEFKRWQAPPILRVSQHAFGRGRRVPIAVKI